MGKLFNSLRTAFFGKEEILRAAKVELNIWQLIVDNEYQQ